MKYVTILNGEQYEIEIDSDGTLLLNGEAREVDFLPLGPSLYSVVMDNKSLQIVIDEEDGKLNVLMNGRMYETQVLDERALMMAQRRGGLTVGGGEINSPMPGLIVTVPVNVGDEVAAGQTVVILESMKMQNELKAPRAGVVHRVSVHTGDNIGHNKLMVSIT
jgi:pyruvate carboxylase subunit B